MRKLFAFILCFLLGYLIASQYVQAEPKPWNKVTYKLMAPEKSYLDKLHILDRSIIMRVLYEMEKNSDCHNALNKLQPLAERGNYYAKYAIGHLNVYAGEKIGCKRTFDRTEHVFDEGIRYLESVAELPWRQQQNKNFVRLSKRLLADVWEFGGIHYTLPSNDGYIRRAYLQHNHFAAFKWRTSYFEHSFDKLYEAEKEKARRSGVTALALAQYYLKNVYTKEKNNTNARLFNKKALRYVRMAVKQKFVPAYYWYGWFLELGAGVKKNPREAFKWYWKTISSISENKLARIIPWAAKPMPPFGKVLTTPNRFVEGRIAHLYSQGLGVPQDPELAYIWFSVAASLGEDSAIKYRDEAAKKLNQKEIRKARAIIKKCWKKRSTCPH